MKSPIPPACPSVRFVRVLSESQRLRVKDFSRGVVHNPNPLLAGISIAPAP
jgi:hypothetical protein